MYQYPKQIQSAFSKSRDGQTLTTLGVEAHFTLERGNYQSEEIEDVNPLEMHAGFSRFLFTIISKGPKGKSFAYANVPAVDDADEIIENTRCAQTFVMSEKLKAPAASEQQLQLPKAYTVSLTMGNNKGKTPAQILLANPGAKDDLLKTKEFLAKNAQKYPANREQMDAIDSAVSLLDSGKLSSGTAKISGAGDKQISIYSADFKPLRSTFENGKVMVYSINISCYPSHRYPYEIQIKNDRAAWDEKTQVAHPAAGDEKTELSIVLTERKWLGIARKMERELQAFETCSYSAQYRKAELAESYNRKIASEAKGTGTQSAMG